MIVFIGVIIFLIFAFGFVVFFGSPYVPTLRRDRQSALDELYTLGERDVLVDLGSGDGVMLREASKRGAKAFGIELNPFLVAISRLLSRGDKNVTVVLGNLRKVHFPKDTTVVYLFGNTVHIPFVSKVILREARRIGRDLSVISYGAELPELLSQKKRGACTLYTTNLYR